MTKRLLAILVCLTLMVGAMAGCSTPAGRSEAESAAGQSSADTASTQPAEGESADSQPAASGEKILRISQSVEPQTLDQQMANSVATQVVIAHIFEPLMRSHNGVVEPGAAESYEMSEDGLTYTFHLREGLKWSDGQPLTAQDYEYGMKRLMDPATASPFAFFGMVLKNGAAVNDSENPMALDELGVKALDEKTVEITLEYPAAYFLGMLGAANFAPCRQDLVEQYGTEFANSAENNAYCGPFIMSEWRKNDRVVLVKNPDYWNKDVVKLDGAEILTVTDTNTAVAMFESGDLHFADVPVALASQYPEADHYYSGANDYVKLNMAEGYPTANKNLRLALNFGISRQDYITLATSGVYEANQRFVLPQVQGVSGEYGTEYPYEAFPLTGDADKAKEYLNTAMSEMGITDPAAIEIELLCSDSDVDRTNCEVIQNQWQSNLGITVTIRQVAYKQRLELEAAKDFMTVFTGWAPDYSDPYTYLELWTSDSPYNHGSYSSPEYDAAIARAIAETDPQVRMDSLFEAEKIFCEDGVVVPLQLRRIPYLQDPNVTGFIHYFVGLMHDFVEADIVG